MRSATPISSDHLPARRRRSVHRDTQHYSDRNTRSVTQTRYALLYWLFDAIEKAAQVLSEALPGSTSWVGGNPSGVTAARSPPATRILRPPHVDDWTRSISVGPQVGRLVRRAPHVTQTAIALAAANLLGAAAIPTDVAALGRGGGGGGFHGGGFGGLLPARGRSWWLGYGSCYAWTPHGYQWVCGPYPATEGWPAPASNADASSYLANEYSAAPGRSPGAVLRQFGAKRRYVA
jgi:hypothetical protein